MVKNIFSIVNRRKMSKPRKAILGSLLLLPQVCDDVAIIAHPDDFYDEANARIYRNVLEMRDTGKPVDPMLLVSDLRNKGIFEAVGGAAYIAEIVDAVPTAAHAEYYAEIVRKKGMLRSLIFASTDIIRDAYDPTAEADEVLSQAEQGIFSVLENRSQSEVQNISDVLIESLKRIDAKMQHDHAAGGLETGVRCVRRFNRRVAQVRTDYPCRPT